MVMRRVLAVLVPVVIVLAGCGRGAGVGGPATGTDFDRRAGQIVSEWHAAGLDTAWTTGFVPLGSLTQVEWDMSIFKGTDIDRASEAKAAIGNGWYRADPALLRGTASQGEIRFPDGKGMTVPLVSAAEAFAALHNPEAPPVEQCGSPTCALTVTGVRLATTTVPTSRGKAVAPAWIFTLAELTVPAVRVAVAPAAVTALPDPNAAMAKARGLSTIDAVEDTAGLRRLTLHFTGGACDAARNGYVYETDYLVVVGAGTVQRPGVCVAIGVPTTVEVKLTQPVGDRILVDAATSQPRALNDCGLNGYRCGRPPAEPSKPGPTPTR
jgi:hypothetical protein